jgi:hypothetical protein
MKDNPLLQVEIIAKDQKCTEHVKKSSLEPASQFQSNLIQNILG